MCLTVRDSVPGVQLLVSGGRSVLMVLKVLLLTMNRMSWARVLQLTRMGPHFSALPFTDNRALINRRDSQTVVLFVLRCMCAVDDDLQAQCA
jgi:hypothetical protein